MSTNNPLTRIRHRMKHDPEFKRQAVERLHAPEMVAKRIAGQRRAGNKKIEFNKLVEPVFAQLAMALQEAGRSASDVAIEAGYDPTTVRDFCYHGRHANPRFRTVQEVARVLGYELVLVEKQKINEHQLRAMGEG